MLWPNVSHENIDYAMVPPPLTSHGFSVYAIGRAWNVSLEVKTFLDFYTASLEAHYISTIEKESFVRKCTTIGNSFSVKYEYRSRLTHK